MRKSKRKWQRAVSLALSSLMVLTMFPADMLAARAAEEKLVNIAGEAAVSIQGAENQWNPKERVNDGDRESTAGLYGGSVSQFKASAAGAAPYDAPCIQLDFGQDRENIKKVTAVTLKADSVGEAGLYQYDCTVYGKSSSQEDYSVLGEGRLSRAATTAESILELDLQQNPVTVSSMVVTLDIPEGGTDCWPLLNEVEIWQGQTEGTEDPQPSSGLENITKDCEITPPSTQGGEGNIKNLYDGNTGTMWINNGAEWPCTVEFALPKANTKCVKKVVLKFEQAAGRSMDVSLQYALNGVTSDLIRVEGSEQTAMLTDGYTFEFETPQAMSHLYVTLDNPLTNGAAGQFWPAIAEAEIYIDNGTEEEVVLENIAVTRKSRVTLEDSVNTEANQGSVTDNDDITSAPLQTQTFAEVEAASGTLPFAEVGFGINQKMRQFVLEMAENAAGIQYRYVLYGKKKKDTDYTEITAGTIGTTAADKRAEIAVSDLEGFNTKEVEYESVKVVFEAKDAAAKNTIPQLAEFQILANQATIAEADEENIVWGTTAIRSNCSQDTVRRVVDGNTKNTWTAERYPAYVDIDLEGEYDLSKIEVYTPQAGYSQYSLYYSNDGQNYTKIGEKDSKESCSASGETWETHVTASSIRILLEYHSENAKALLNEIRVFGDYRGPAAKAEFVAPKDFAGSEYDVEVTSQDAIEEVQGIVRRNLGSAFVDWFEFVLGEKGNYDYFDLEDTADGKVRITGNSGVSMAMGLNHYLKYFCNVSITQVGNQVKMPAAIVPVGEKVHKECKVSVRYAYNYCTMSYSMPFWGEDEWRKELDWLALNGVNTVLDTTGQEEVWRRFLKKIGYDHADIKDYLAGPAFYAWAYMANLSGWGGPVHDSWFTERTELARKNQLSMRKLGMQPILQGYSGMVPVDIVSKAKGNYVLESGDVIAQGIWCGFQRPYMLRTTSDIYEKYAGLFYDCQKEVYGDVTHYYATDPFHEGGNTGGMDAADVSSNVLDELLVSDPEAVWVIQAWQGNPSAALVNGLAGRKEHALVLDLYAEKEPHWKDSGYAGGKEFQKTPWIYCMLNNFGGRMGLHGHMDNLVNGVAEAVNTAEKMAGIGIAPEASQNNPVLYDLLFESVWCDDASQPLAKIDTESWLRSYVTRRYGAESENAYQAMLILEDTVYKASLNMTGQGAPESYINARPAASISAASSWGNSVIGYDMTKLEEAAVLLLKDYDTLKESDGYLYDLADILKQVLSNTSQKYHREMVSALNEGNLEAFTEASDRFLGLIDKVEEVLKTRKEFLLGTWVEQAKALAVNADDFSKDLYEFNAKAIVTTWGTYANTESGGLRDYSNRQWAGLTKDFYRQRWAMWIDYNKEVLAGNSPASINWFEFEWAWARANTEYTSEVSGTDLGELGREILADYSVSEKTVVSSPELQITAPSAGETPEPAAVEGYQEGSDEITFGDGVAAGDTSESIRFVKDGEHNAFQGRYQLNNPAGADDAFDISGRRPFVISFWMKLDSGAADGTYSIVGKMNKQYGVQAVRKGGNDYIQMYANAGGGWPTYCSVTTDLTEWTFVTALYDGHHFWLSVGDSPLQTNKLETSSGSDDFALVSDSGSKFTIGYNYGNASNVTCPGLLSDVKMYVMSAEDSANVIKPENPEGAAALAETLKASDPILEVSARVHTPYTLESKWSAAGMDSVTAFEPGISYTITTLLTADTGYLFTEESIPSAIWIGDIAVPIAEGEVIVSENGSVMTVTHTFEPLRAAVSSILLDQTSLTFTEAGVSQLLTATILPENAANKNVIWESSNPDVVTVADGVVTAVAEGSAVITAKAADNEEVSAVCNVTVQIAYADYTAVDAAIEKAEALSESQYTDASWKALQDAVKAVERGKKASEQDVVDAMAQAINSALASLERHYTVTVVKGTLKENRKYKYGEMATVTADAPESGMKFAYWEMNGKPVCYAVSYSFYVMSDITVTACYAASEEEIKQQVTMICTAVYNASTKKITFTAKRSLPEGCKVLEHGIIITDSTGWNSFKDNEKEKFVVGASRIRTAKGKTTGLLGNYSASLTCTKSDEWYGKGYVRYQAPDGTVAYAYSSVTQCTVTVE